LGSNIEPRLERLDAACEALRHLPHTWLAAVSSIYESEPAYKEDQASFANAVVSLQTTLPPEDLLRRLQDIEEQEGRVRHEANGPRTLDLDLIDYEGETRATPELTLPHPGILERDFVVRPLLELYPAHALADGNAVADAQVRVGTVTDILRPRF
ncbi:MAG: 2-amino-4-hydroxy-6-hydroxymethyldihydropteridine diphosphokinase, partial [Coriobacteriaceae bacterium]|nr:2-amino-4-hydroxy-6-hydroxymethyldihydropteridine diphosphokinase [Coriobacteriaceae bacterium]